MAQPTLEDILDMLLQDPAQDLLLNSMKTSIDEAENNGKIETPYDLNFGQADARLTVQGNGWHAVADLVNRYLSERGWWFHQIEEARDVPPISRGILKRIPDNQVSAQPADESFEQSQVSEMDSQHPESQNNLPQVDQVQHQNAHPIDSSKKRGVCKWYNMKKGFGFITPDDDSISDVFVHRSEIHARSGALKILLEEEIVEFYIQLDDQGRAKAVSVTGPEGSFVKGRRKRPAPRRVNKAAPSDVHHVESSAAAGARGGGAGGGSDDGDGGLSPQHQSSPSSNNHQSSRSQQPHDYTNSQSSHVMNGSSSSNKIPHDPSVVVTGKCKWYNIQKGFGFVTPDDGSPDIFVHRSEVNSNSPYKSLAEGESVEFFVRIDDQGRPKAVSVTGPSGSFVQGAVRRRRLRPRAPRNRKQFNGNGSYDEASYDQYSSEPHSNNNGEVKSSESYQNNSSSGEKEQQQVFHRTLDMSKIDTNAHHRGVCKWFNRKKGFGFITIENTDMDVFVNRADLNSDSDFKTLAEGEKVEFYLGVDEEQRPKAMDVTGPNGTYVRGHRPPRNSRRLRR